MRCFGCVQENCRFSDDCTCSCHDEEKTRKQVSLLNTKKVFKLYWEQESWKVEHEGDGCTSLHILEQVGQKGRAAFIEILSINYRDELLKEYEQLRRYENSNFSAVARERDRWKSQSEEYNKAIIFLEERRDELLAQRDDAHCRIEDLERAQKENKDSHVTKMDTANTNCTCSAWMCDVPTYHSDDCPAKPK